jgi:hypothetical protein
MTIQLLDTVMSPEARDRRKYEGGPGGPGRGWPPGGPPAGPVPESTAMARRPGTLENKIVYLVDTGFGGSYRFMQQLQKWFAANMPSVKTIRKRKPGNVFMDDNPELWEEVKAKGDAVVLGVAG